ncbi:MAG TPA: PAS domain S-box protein [Pyrinomonadaceae bacterium]|nr:PAS domain S-box protein [Pyrinomonadaceae bacterium]
MGIDAIESSAFLSAIVESSNDAIIGKSLAGEILSWNTAAEKLYGYTAGEAVGRNISFIIPPERGAELKDILARISRGERVESFETVRVRKDGARLDVALTISPVKDAQGRILGASAISRNITERKEAERERAELLHRLEEQRRRLSDIVRSVPGVVWEAWGEPDEAEQRINFVSDYVEKMLGYTVNEWLSTPNFWLTIVHPEDRERAAQEARAKFLSDEGGTSQFRWLTKDGRALWVEAHSAPIKDEAGLRVGMRGVTMDITGRKQAEEGEARLREEVIRAQESLLVELSTPLIPIKKGIVAMPLIGSMSSERAAQMLSALLQGVRERCPHTAIIDITGVPTVDTQVASALIDAAAAVELMGTEVVITGIRGRVAQTLIGLGVDLGTIVTRRNLQSGIEYAERSR